jgi:hypothetical protein
LVNNTDIGSDIEPKPLLYSDIAFSALNDIHSEQHLVNSLTGEQTGKHILFIYATSSHSYLSGNSELQCDGIGSNQNLRKSFSPGHSKSEIP